MDIKGRVAVVTGGASGIGWATTMKFAREGLSAVGVVDMHPETADMCARANAELGREVLVPFAGDVVKPEFREQVFETLEKRFGPVALCVPAAGITRDRLCVKVKANNGSTTFSLYAEEDFRRTIDVNLLAPVYWAMRTVASVAVDRAKRCLGPWQPEEGVQGGIVLIGSVSSAGNRGQISYATTKAGLEGAQATLSMEAIYYGVRCAIIHPGFTDTPMVRALGDDLIQQRILPHTQLRRLIRPDEIAEAIFFMLSNSSISGCLWADAGWYPNG